MLEKVKRKLFFLEKALLRLGEMVNEPVGSNRAEIDSSIQRFEFCVELFWKTLKVVLESKGQQVAFPKDVLKASYQGRLINDEKAWLEMLRDRNETSHVYDEEVADKIYERIKTVYYPEMKKTFDVLRQEYGVIEEA